MCDLKHSKIRQHKERQSRTRATGGHTAKACRGFCGIKRLRSEDIDIGRVTSLSTGLSEVIEWGKVSCLRKQYREPGSLGS